MTIRVYDQEVESGSLSVSTGTADVEQHVLGSTVWAALASLVEDLGQAVVDIPIAGDCLSVFGGMVDTLPDLGKKHATICFTMLFDHLNFPDGISPRKTHTADCCFLSESYRRIHISPLVAKSQTRLDRPPSNFFA